MRYLHRHLCLGKLGQCLAKASLRITGAGREADAALSQRRNSRQIVARVQLGALGEVAGHGPCILEPVRAEMDVDEQSEQRRRRGAERVNLLEGPLEYVGRERRL